MNAMEALTACLEALDKIAEKNGPLEASSGMDWRRKVKHIAAGAAKVAEKAIACEVAALRMKARNMESSPELEARITAQVVANVTGPGIDPTRPEAS